MEVLTSALPSYGREGDQAATGQRGKRTVRLLFLDLGGYLLLILLLNDVGVLLALLVFFICFFLPFEAFTPPIILLSCCVLEKEISNGQKILSRFSTAS